MATPTTTKYCSRCDQDKPHSEFARNRASRHGLCAYCKTCQREYNRAYWRDKTPNFTKADSQKKRCTRCRKPKPKTEFAPCPLNKDGLRNRCKACDATHAARMDDLGHSGRGTASFRADDAAVSRPDKHPLEPTYHNPLPAGSRAKISGNAFTFIRLQENPRPPH